MFRCWATASANDVDQTFFHVFFNLCRHLIGCLIILTQTRWASRHWGGHLTKKRLFIQYPQVRAKRRSTPTHSSKPMLARVIRETEIKKASAVWPESILPLASVMVPDTITGISPAQLFKQFLNGKEPGFYIERIGDCFQQNISTPPSIKPFACSLNATTSWSNVIARKPGIVQHQATWTTSFVVGLHGASHKTRFVRFFLRELISNSRAIWLTDSLISYTKNSRNNRPELTHVCSQMCWSPQYRPRLKVLTMNLANDVGPRDAQQIVVAFQRVRMIFNCSLRKSFSSL